MERNKFRWKIVSKYATAFRAREHKNICRNADGIHQDGRLETVQVIFDIKDNKKKKKQIDCLKIIGIFAQKHGSYKQSEEEFNNWWVYFDWKSWDL